MHIGKYTYLYINMSLKVFHVTLHSNQQCKFSIRENFEHLPDYILLRYRSDRRK